MTDAHARLKPERDAVIRLRLWDEQRTGLPSALDALIEKAMALGAEPLVAALEQVNYCETGDVRKDTGCLKFAPGRRSVWCDSCTIMEAALAATGGKTE